MSLQCQNSVLYTVAMLNHSFSPHSQSPAIAAPPPPGLSSSSPECAVKWPSIAAPPLPFSSFSTPFHPLFLGALGPKSQPPPLICLPPLLNYQTPSWPPLPTYQPPPMMTPETVIKSSLSHPAGWRGRTGVSKAKYYTRFRVEAQNVSLIFQQFRAQVNEHYKRLQLEREAIQPEQQADRECLHEVTGEVSRKVSDVVDCVQPEFDPYELVEVVVQECRPLPVVKSQQPIEDIPTDDQQELNSQESISAIAQNPPESISAVAQSPPEAVTNRRPVRKQKRKPRAQKMPIPPNRVRDDPNITPKRAVQQKKRSSNLESLYIISPVRVRRNPIPNNQTHSSYLINSSRLVHDPGGRFALISTRTHK